MSRQPQPLLSLAVCGLLLAACAQQAGDATVSAAPSRPLRSAPPLATVPASTEPVIGEVPADILARLVADAVERAGIDPGDVEVVQAAAMTWSDGSLGCPEPGMLYTQALVEGYHVILEAGGEQLDYRVTANGAFRLCEGGRPGG